MKQMTGLYLMYKLTLIITNLHCTTVILNIKLCSFPSCYNLRSLFFILCFHQEGSLSLSVWSLCVCLCIFLLLALLSEEEGCPMQLFIQPPCCVIFSSDIENLRFMSMNYKQSLELSLYSKEDAKSQVVCFIACPTKYLAFPSQIRENNVDWQLMRWQLLPLHTLQYVVPLPQH